MILIDFLSLDQGKPTTIMADIYVESFGNIEEANMVRKLCSLIFHRLHRLFVFDSLEKFKLNFFRVHKP